MLVGLGAIWGGVALVFAGWLIWMFSSFSHSAVHVKTFNPATYRGAVGTVVFAYDGEGDVLFHHAEPNTEPDKRILWKTAITTGCATLPVGRIGEMRVHFSVTNAWGRVGMLSWFYTKENGTFTLESGGRHEVAGGFPLTASIRVEGGVEGGQCDMSFDMSDTAGNHVAVDGVDDSPLEISFEAVAPDGTCFWRGRLEFDSYRGEIPIDAPSTFTIRPVIGNALLDIRAGETQVSRDELLRETLKRREKWLKEDEK